MKGGQVSHMKTSMPTYQARNPDNTTRTPGTYQARNADNTTRTPGTYQRHDENCNPVTG